MCDIKAFFDAEWGKITFLLVILAFSTMFSIFKGGDQMYSIVGVKLCSPVYWILSFVMVPVIIIAWGITAKFLMREYEKKKEEGREIEGEIKYTYKNILLLGILSVIAGCLASLLGIGGGMIKGPVLLQMGLVPDVTAATSSYMIVSFPKKKKNIYFTNSLYYYYVVIIIFVFSYLHQHHQQFNIF